MEIPNNLLPTRFRWGAGSAHGEYFIEAEPGVTPDMVVAPDFWLNLAARLKVHDRIEVVAKDGSFDMDVRVTGVDPRGLYAVVRMLRFTGEHDQPAVVPTVVIPDNDGYTIEQDRVQGWRVLRGRDLIEKGLPDKAAAEAARDAHKAGKPIKRVA